MRILALRFSNLNSLYGEWKVDFTHPELLDQGIFAITGPTGSGKSTLLDAICLALYGRTPRLKNISKSSNHLMSRNRGECYAELHFQTPAGRFRCYWEQHRARKNPQGKLSESRHELSKLDTGEILEEKKREVAQRIIGITGMDFQRFTRSMLLAQGGFAAFLQAQAQDRAPILEQITGTDIYSAISQEVHQRFRVEEDKFKMLTAGAEYLELPTPEEQKALKEEMEAKEGMLKALREQRARLLEKKQMTDRLEVLIGEEQELKGEKNRLDLLIPRMDELKAKCDTLNRWRELQPPWQKMEQLKQQIQRLERDMDIPKARLPHCQAELAALNQREAQGELQLHQLDGSLEELNVLLQKISPLILQIQERELRLTELDGEIQKTGQSMAQRRQETDQLNRELKVKQQNLEEVQSYLKENSSHQILVEEFRGMEEQLISYTRGQRDMDSFHLELVNLKEEIIRAQGELEKSLEAFNDKGEELRRVDQQQNDLNQEIKSLLQGKLIREWREKKDRLLTEQLLINRIKSLEEERALLKDGEPCPLCGSLEHPFVKGHGQSDKTDEIDRVNKLIAAYEKQEESLRTLQQKQREMQSQYDELEKNHWQGKEKLSQLHINREDRERRYEDFELQQKRRKAHILEILSPLGIQGLDDDLMETLRKHRDGWQHKSRQLEEINHEIGLLSSRLENLISSMKEQQNRQTQWEERKISLQSERDELESKKRDLLQDRDPQKEEREKRQSRQDMAGQLAQMKDQSQKLSLEEANLKSSLQTLKDTVKTLEENLLEREKDFRNLMEEHGWSSMDLYIREGENLPLQDQWLGEIGSITEQIQQWNTRKEQNHKEQTLQKDKLNHGDVRSLKVDQLSQLDEQLHGQSEVLGSLKEKQQRQDQLLRTINEKQQQIEEQRESLQRWAKLHGLIGSADGRKFREFAQGITFQRLIAQSNIQLRKLFDRYLLIAHESEPLELNVQDLYQAGEIRSTRNLSGGESFIISLALALGLSSMSSRKVSVDSLFLDEGFGTLDEETLDCALMALSELRQQGKLIGVISHVPALKERITTQIKVQPLSSGKSKLSGPGCTRL